ncbi:hypothetical protein KKF55_00165 [Patescibacteria group bacterium]|nr:hypothetical protein [Patescibacteria group bacterium]
MSNSNLSPKICDEIFEGWLWVNSSDRQGAQGNDDDYTNAIPTKFTLTDPDDGDPDVYYYSYIDDLDETITTP